MGEDIMVETREGVGSTFNFNIRFKTKGISQKDQLYQDENLTGKKVLIIDDNHTSLDVLKDQLHHWGLAPTVALKAETAFEILDAEPNFDLIIADMHLKEIDNFNPQNKNAFSGYTPYRSIFIWERI